MYMMFPERLSWTVNLSPQRPAIFNVYGGPGEGDTRGESGKPADGKFRTEPSTGPWKMARNARGMRARPEDACFPFFCPA